MRQVVQQVRRFWVSDRRLRRAVWVLSVAAVGVSAPVGPARAAARGGQSTDGQSADSQSRDRQSHGGVSAEIGYAQLAGASLLDVRLKAGWTRQVGRLGCADGAEAGACRTQFRLAGQIPLRFRLSDGPSNQPAGLRRADWDEPGDWLRIIRGIEYGRPDEIVHAEIGELGPYTLGHGSIIQNYYNVINIDQVQRGATAALNTGYGGVELMVDNVVGPSLIGGRVYVRPWSFVDADSVWSRIALGATWVSDVDAPTRLVGRAPAVDDTGRPVVGGEMMAGEMAADEMVAADQRTALVGADLEVTAVDTAHVGVVPYVDFVHHQALGNGLHAGAYVSVWPADALELRAQLEYRRVGPQYLPAYVSALYEVSRFQFSGWGQPLAAPKIRVAASRQQAAVHGVYGSVGASLSGLFRISAAYADHQGPANQMVHLAASATPVERWQLGVFYHRQTLDGLDELVGLDGALIAAESRATIWGPLFAVGRYGRMWQVGADGRYQSVNDWKLGVGASLGF